MNRLAKVWACVILAASLAWAPLCLAGALDDMETDMAGDNIASGLAAHARGDHDGAIARYTLAIDSKALDKESLAIAYNNRGNAYDDKGQSDKALADYDQAIRLSPAFSEAFYNRAFARHRLGQYEQALQDYDRVLFLEPDLASGYFNRSFTQAALGRYDRAVADVGKALQLSPGNAKYQEQLLDWKEILSSPPAAAKPRP
jgi:tetratricopeptide (TPR) repeat protein